MTNTAINFIVIKNNIVIVQLNTDAVIPIQSDHVSSSFVYTVDAVYEGKYKKLWIQPVISVQADSGSVMLLHVFFWRSQRLLMKLASVLTVATHTNPVPDHLQHFMVAKFPGGDGLFHHNPADPSPSCTFVTTLIPRIT